MESTFISPYFKTRALFFLGLLVLTISPLRSQTVARKEFPKPEGIKNMLFYIQRTMNANTIIYEFNVDEKDEIDIKNPIKIYWISYAQKGEIEPLNYIQSHYAYGIDVKLTDPVKKSFSFTFVSYKKQSIYLLKSTIDNKYHAYAYLNNKLIIVKSLFIQIEGGSFWAPKVKYIEVTGRDPAKNIDIVEKIIP